MNIAAATRPAALPDPARPLDRRTAEAAFAAIIDGDVSDTAIAGFLTALAARGETASEIAAAASALRARMTRVAAPPCAIDVCGTGGDGRHTLNVSTAVAIIVAACGVPVAKHGNRAASSRSGAADVLEALGVRTDLDPAAAARCLATLDIAFLHAARHHPAVARVAAVRRQLGIRTVFNLIGPLANPAGVSRQLVGVPAPRWVAPIAEALGALGTVCALVVHGEDGIDELSTAGPTRIAWLRRGVVSEAVIAPEDAGLARHDPAGLTGGDPAYNAAALATLLGGATGAYRDTVLLNAAGALLVADAATDWRDGASRAAAAIDTGAAAALLDRWRAFA